MAKLRKIEAHTKEKTGTHRGRCRSKCTVALHLKARKRQGSCPIDCFVARAGSCRYKRFEKSYKCLFSIESRPNFASENKKNKINNNKKNDYGNNE